MGLFSKFHENADEGEERGERSDVASEKGLMESVGEMLEHSVQAVFGAGEADVGAVTRGLAMDDPFSQSDHVVAAVVEHDVRAASGEEGAKERRTIVQVVRENLAQSAHIVRDAVLSHTADASGAQFAQAATPIEDGASTEDHRRTIMEAVGDIMSHPVQTVKDIIGSHSDVVEASPGDATQESPGVPDPGLRKEPEQDEEVKGLIQIVHEAAQEVKEEMLEVVQEVKDAVMSNDTLPNVQTESITEDAGERPSMELVHTIVHD